MDELELLCGDAIIKIRREVCYTLGSADNLHRYDREYKLTDDNLAVAYGIECQEVGGQIHSCLLAASGAPTWINEHSCVVRDASVVIAVGDSLCHLSIPDLAILWHKRIIDAACIGVYWSEKHHCLLVHGELSITRVSLEGEVAWQAYGRAMLTGGFRLLGDQAIVEDEEHYSYQIDLATGRSKRGSWLRAMFRRYWRK